MKRIIRVLTIALVIVTILATPAHALPNRWKGTPKFTRAGVTYRVKGHDAVVVKTKGKRVTIPAEIKYRGKWYEVRALWDGSLKGVKRVTIHADLETCEDARLWKIPVKVTRKGMYKWLKRTGANVSLIHCDGCGK